MSANCHCERSAAIPWLSAKLCRPEQSEGSLTDFNQKQVSPLGILTPLGGWLDRLAAT